MRAEVCKHHACIHNPLSTKFYTFVLNVPRAMPTAPVSLSQSLAELENVTFDEEIKWMAISTQFALIGMLGQSQRVVYGSRIGTLFTSDSRARCDTKAVQDHRSVVHIVRYQLLKTESILGKYVEQESCAKFS